MLKTVVRSGALALAVLSLAATSALASVTFNPSNGTGFVGKGDVQTALGLNNAQMQAQAKNLTFTYVTTDTYQVVNAWATGNVDQPVSLGYHTATVTKTVGVNSTVLYDARTRNQVTGFNLTGPGSSTTTGTVPVVSPTVTYVTFRWDEQVWTGEWTQVSCPTRNDPDKMCNGDKIYQTVTHETDQLPVDEDGNLYTEGNNKAVLSVTLLDSIGGLQVTVSRSSSTNDTRAMAG